MENVKRKYKFTSRPRYRNKSQVQISNGCGPKKTGPLSPISTRPSEKFESAGHGSLKNPIRVVLSTGSTQPGHVGRAIAANDILPLFGVVQVQVRVAFAYSPGGMCRPPHPLLGCGLNPRVVGRIRPGQGE